MNGNSSEPGVIPKGNTGGGLPGGRDGTNMEGYASRTILMTAILVLILAMVLGFLVHMYARWCWVHYAARRRRRQRRETNLSVQDSFRPNPVSVGLDKAAIESLPIFVYQPEKEAMARKEGGEGYPECAVCLSEFKENEKGRSLPKCKHVFHTDCIDMWFQSHSTCPLCRVPVLAPLNHPLEQPLAATTEEIHQREASEQNANPAGESEPPASSSSEGGFNNRPLGNNPGVEYPTNILFWGDHAHVSSRISALSADPISQTGGNSPHSSVDIPDSTEVSANNVATERIDGGGGSNTDEQTSFSPVARLKSIKRLLSRDRRVNPAEQDDKDLEQDVGVSDR